MFTGMDTQGTNGCAVRGAECGVIPRLLHRKKCSKWLRHECEGEPVNHARISSDVPDPWYCAYLTPETLPAWGGVRPITCGDWRCGAQH